MKAGEKILRLIRQRDTTQAEVASKVGVAYSTFRSYLDPEHPRLPSSETAIRIARVLGVSADSLWDDALDVDVSLEPSASMLGDAELLDELSRRRKLIERDRSVLVERFAAPGALTRLESLADMHWRGESKSFTASERESFIAGHMDVERFVFLWRRIVALDLGRECSEEHNLKPEVFFSECPNVLRWVQTSEPRNEVALLGHYEPGELTPVFENFGEVIDRVRYAGLGCILQRRFVPILADPESGPPSDDRILYQRWQTLPERYNRFVRFDAESPDSFGYVIADDEIAPKYPRGGIVICQPGEPDRSSKAPALVVYDRGRKTGIFFVNGDRLVTAGGRALKLRSDDKPSIYPIVAGPFPPTGPDEQPDKKNSRRGKN